MKARELFKRPQWYRMEAFFDGKAQAVTEVGDAQIVLQGTIYEGAVACPACDAKVHLDKITLTKDARADLSPQLGICLIPQEAVSNTQGEGLRRLLEANLRMPVVLISNNVQLVQLRPIHEAEADRILSGEGDDGGKVVAFKNRKGERPGGQDIREADRPRSESDPGSPGTD